MGKWRVPEQKRVPFKTKVAFGLGNAGEQVASVTVGSYAMLYYNQVLGLPAHLAGLALSASLLADGLADPISGGVSDRTRSRWGRRHPFLYFSPIAIVLAFLALWNPPSGLGETALFVWFLVSVSAVRWSVSFYETPRMALGGELSPNYTERSTIMAYDRLLGFVGTFSATWIALTFFFKATPEYPRGLLNPDPWPEYSLFMAVAMIVLLYASPIFTHERVKFLPKVPKHLPRLSVMEFFKDIGMAIRNRNFVLILIAFFFTSMMIGMRNALHIYVNTFFWGLTSEELRWLAFGAFGGLLTAFFLIPRLHDWIEKKWTMVGAALLYSTAPSIPVWLGMLGVIDPGDPLVLPTIVLFGALHSGVAAISLVSVLSMLADIADENELRYGVRQEGVLFATRSLFGKVDQAIGAAFAGFVLTLIAFPTKAQVGEIEAQVLRDLLLWDAVIAVIPGCIAAAIYTRLRLSRRSYEETRAKLDKRRSPLPLLDDESEPNVDGGAVIIPPRT